MTTRRLALCMTAVLGAFLLSGCQCDENLPPSDLYSPGVYASFYDNVSGADLKSSLNGIGYAVTQSVDDYHRAINDLACQRGACWWDTGKTDLSGFESNVTGEDWKRTMQWLRNDSNLNGNDWRETVGCPRAKRYSTTQPK